MQLCVLRKNYLHTKHAQVSSFCCIGSNIYIFQSNNEVKLIGTARRGATKHSFTVE